MGFVAFVFVVGGLGFLGYLIWSQLRTLNRHLEQMLGGPPQPTPEVSAPPATPPLVMGGTFAGPGQAWPEQRPVRTDDAYWRRNA